MNIETRIKWTLIGSIILSFPAMRNLSSGQLDVPAFGLYYVTALLLSSFFVSTLHKVVVRFTFDLIKSRIERDTVRPQRRRADRPAPTGQTEAVPEAGGEVPSAPEELVS